MSVAEAVIQRHCDRAGVQPGELLAHLLDGLLKVQSGEGIAGLALAHGDRASVFHEIRVYMRLTCRPAEVPVSLLATLEMFCQVLSMVTAAGLPAAADAGGGAVATPRNSAVAQALWGVTRELAESASAAPIPGRADMDEHGPGA